MLGYRVYSRIASRPDAADAPPMLVGSTTELVFTVEGLPPQTLLSLFVVAENILHPGLASVRALYICICSIHIHKRRWLLS